MKKKLFKQATTDVLRRTAVVGGYWATDGMYIIGYRDGAEVLIEYAQSHGGQDALFYPICFLYRHATELSLKNLVLDGLRVSEAMVRIGEMDQHHVDAMNTIAESVLSKHDLRNLLNLVVKILDPLTDERIPSSVVTTINQLNAIDAKGETFRYSTDKNRSRWLKKEEHVDFVQLHDDLSAVITHLFYGVGTWLEHRLEWAIEVEKTRRT